MKSSSTTPTKPEKEEPRAQHGWRSEITWEGGSGRQGMPSGRQPYGNRGDKEIPGSAPLPPMKKPA